jgi:hypothetical protein
MTATHGCLTSMKGDAMTFLSGDGRAAQTGKERLTHARDPDYATSRAVIT